MERSWLLLSSITSGAKFCSNSERPVPDPGPLQCIDTNYSGYLVNLSLPANNTLTFRIMEEECLRELDFIFNLQFTIKIFILRPPAKYNVYTTYINFFFHFRSILRL